MAAELRRWRDMVAGLGDAELVLGTGCRGWQIAHLLVHVRFDAEALLAGLYCPTDDPVDRDFASYWAEFPANPAPTFAQLRTGWAMTAAYASGDSLRAHFLDVVTPAAAAATGAAGGRLRFQGHVLDTDDFLVMWAVELAIHHLDLLPELPGRDGPEPRAVEMAVATLDGLTGGRLGGWDDLTYLRKGTGRAALDDVERDGLGDASASYPAFG